MQKLMCCALLALLGGGLAAVEGKGVKAVLQNLPGDVRGLIFSPDDRLLAVSTGQVIKLYDWQTGKEVATVQGGLGAAFSPDGQVLAYPGQDEANNDGVMLWDLLVNKKRSFIADDNVHTPVFPPGGGVLAGSVGGRIKIYDLTSSKAAAAIAGAHKVSITAMAYVHDGKQLISADARGGFALWDTSEATPKKVADFKREGDDTQVNALASTRNGPRVACAMGGGDIVILDAGKLTSLGGMKGSAKNLPVKSVSFAPDCQLLASVCAGVEDIEVKLWDAQNMKQIFSFSGHTGGVNCVCFTNDGKYLASGSDDKTVKIWEVASLLQQSIPAPPKPAPKKEE